VYHRADQPLLHGFHQVDQDRSVNLAHRFFQSAN
jgi:hypothetical protein